MLGAGGTRGLNGSKKYNKDCIEKNLNILDKSADVNPLHVVFSR